MIKSNCNYRITLLPYMSALELGENGLQSLGVPLCEIEDYECIALDNLPISLFGCTFYAVKKEEGLCAGCFFLYPYGYRVRLEFLEKIEKIK